MFIYKYLYQVKLFPTITIMSQLSLYYRPAGNLGNIYIYSGRHSKTSANHFTGHFCPKKRNTTLSLIVPASQPLKNTFSFGQESRWKNESYSFRSTDSLNCSIGPCRYYEGRKGPTSTPHKKRTKDFFSLCCLNL